ncbi:unnamed protein product [Prunus armeniaca]|uniref:Pentatricopeptide repeat-containing protein n=1 Tax=Prunus armeniaca TaxID=36596 RepID=A0A6J5XBM7_PRUAR|nr:unnamed protein product [Prunus armeniaca]
MLRTEIKPDNFTYACIIRACSESFYLEGLKLVHCGVTVSGLGLDSICSSALVTAYSKLGLVDEASWQLFSEMRSMEMMPDGYTIVGLLSGLSDSSLITTGQGLHGLCLKCNLDSNAHPDLVTWSALITGYSQSGDCGKALFFFKDLNMEGKKADSILIASVLAAVAQIGNVGPGCEIHAYVLRHGLESHVMISSALIVMYSKCSFLGMGTHVFEIMPEKNIISYNSLILGLGLHGLASEAFRVFDEILRNGLKPDEYTFTALLGACCHAGLVKDGREIFRIMKD